MPYVKIVTHASMSHCSVRDIATTMCHAVANSLDTDVTNVVVKIDFYTKNLDVNPPDLNITVASRSFVGKSLSHLDKLRSGYTDALRNINAVTKEYLDTHKCYMSVEPIANSYGRI